MKPLTGQAAYALSLRRGQRAGSHILPASESPAHFCVLRLLTTAREVRAALARRMKVQVFSEAQLAILVALHASDPMSVSAGTLSFQTGISFRHLILAIDLLIASDLLEEDSDLADDRKGFFKLTPGGRETAVVAAHLFLEAVDELTDGLTAVHFSAWEETCQHLTDRARRLRA